MTSSLSYRDFSAEIHFRFARSGGPGGQNVNKLNTKAEARFNINESQLLGHAEKARLFLKLKSKITKEGELVLENQSERTQLRNKELAQQKMNDIINRALIKAKRRKPTQPTLASIRKRLEKKKKRSLKKGGRQKPEI